MVSKLQEIPDKEEDWNVDYDPEYGQSATCPRCGSEDVSLTFGEACKDRLHATYFVCYDCEHASDWEGPNANLALKKYGHPNKDNV